MVPIPRDCWSVVFSFTPWGDIPGLALVCRDTAEALPYGLRRMYQGWGALAPDEALGARGRGRMPRRALYRNVLWDGFLRRLNADPRLPDGDKTRLWNLMHWWRVGGAIPHPWDMAWMDHVLDNILSCPPRPGASAVRLAETAAELCPIRWGDYAISPGGFIRRGDRPLGAIIGGRWLFGRDWPRPLGEHLDYLENNPMRILTDANGTCPFCGRPWGHPKAVGEECAMRIAEWASWVGRVK